VLALWIPNAAVGVMQHHRDDAGDVALTTGSPVVFYSFGWGGSMWV